MSDATERAREIVEEWTCSCDVVGGLVDMDTDRLVRLIATALGEGNDDE